MENEAGGEQSIARLEAEGKVFKPTLEAATPSGGRHLYYRFAPGITNSASLVAPGIDIRGEGGYVLAAPSTIAGAAYAWINDLPVARLPMWLEMTLKPSPKCRPKPFCPVRRYEHCRATGYRGSSARAWAEQYPVLGSNGHARGRQSDHAKQSLDDQGCAWDGA